MPKILTAKGKSSDTHMLCSNAIGRVWEKTGEVERYAMRQGKSLFPGPYPRKAPERTEYVDCKGNAYVLSPKAKAQLSRIGFGARHKQFRENLLPKEELGNFPKPREPGQHDAQPKANIAVDPVAQEEANIERLETALANARARLKEKKDALISS